MTPAAIPFRVEDLAPGWVQDALHTSGALPAASRVTVLATTPVGERGGVNGDAFRVLPAYEGAPGPARLIAKFGTPGVRGVAVFQGWYEREVRFYEQFAAETPLRTPRAYAVALRVLGAASGLAVLALWSGIPATYDTGRFLGLALGVVMLGSTRIEEDLSALARLGRIALAASLFAGAWWITGVMLEATELSHTPIGGLLAGALPLALVLPGPIWIQRVLASALQRQPERAGPG